MCCWHQDNLGRSSMSDFVVVSSDLRMKRGVALSTERHLVVSWLRCWGRMPVRPTRIVRVYWEYLAESTQLQELFNHVPEETGDIESECQCRGGRT